MRASLVIAVLTLCLPAAQEAAGEPSHRTDRVIVAQHAGASAATSDGAENLSPEQKMQRRFPQPVRVGDLIGLPALDDYDATIGHVRHVVRSSAGKLQLVVTYGGLLGWGQRLVIVPIEAVAMLGRQIAAVDMPREAFATAPIWSGSKSDLVEFERDHPHRDHEAMTGASIDAPAGRAPGSALRW